MSLAVRATLELWSSGRWRRPPNGCCDCSLLVYLLHFCIVLGFSRVYSGMACMYIHIVCMHLCMCKRMCMSMCMSMDMYMEMYMYMCICVYVYMYICIYVYLMAAANAATPKPEGRRRQRDPQCRSAQEEAEPLNDPTQAHLVAAGSGRVGPSRGRVGPSRAG